MDKYFISSEGLQKIKDELNILRNKRNEIVRRISEAKNQGDISENAEYEEAKESQAFNEGRIIKLEEMIRNCVVVAKGKNKTVVDIGSTLEIQNKDKKSVFTIVGPEESNPSENFISNESPLGEALVGKKKGDVVEIETPGGKVKYKIIDIK